MASCIPTLTAIRTDFVYTDEAQHVFSPEIQRWTTGLITSTLFITPTCTSTSGISDTIQVTVTYQHRFLTGPVIMALGGKDEVKMQTVTTMFTERTMWKVKPLRQGEGG